MEWDLIEEQSEVCLGQIFYHTTVSVNHDKNIVELLLGSLEAEYPVSETSSQASMFINQFIDVEGDFCKAESRVLGWVYSSDKYWWSRMIGSSLKI